MKFNPGERDPIRAADWTELQALYSELYEFSIEGTRSYIDTEGTLATEEDIADAPPYEFSESFIASTEAEIERRARIAQEAYPFKLINGVLQVAIEKKYLPYLFCLLLADREFYEPGEKQSNILFEHLVRETLKSYLGGEAVRFGKPRDTMLPGIHDAIDELASLTGNRKLNYGYPVNAIDEDLGLDVVAWKNFSDKNCGKVELYLQCASGLNWKTKKHDFEIMKWGNILFWPFNPIKGLAIPYVVSISEWERTTSEILLVDRLRIASVLEGQKLPDSTYHWWGWCQERIQEGKQREN